MGPLAFFDLFKTRRALAVPIAVVNLVGIAYGFYYYLPQFQATPVYLWPFVPDSPLAVLWAELALLAWWLGRKPGALDALAVVGNVQVGLWTVYVLLAYAQDGTTVLGTRYLGMLFPRGELHVLNAVLLVAHAGMVLLALLFLHGLRERRRASPRAYGIALGVAAAYYLLNDLLDYFGPDHLGKGGCGIRPHTIPCDPVLEPVTTFVTFGLTALGLLALHLAARRD